MATYTAKERRESGTIKDSKTGKKTKFPVKDKEHAILAVGFENRAKPPLTSEQKATIDRKAAKYGVGPLAKKKSPKKVK